MFLASGIESSDSLYISNYGYLKALVCQHVVTALTNDIFFYFLSLFVYYFCKDTRSEAWFKILFANLRMKLKLSLNRWICFPRTWLNNPHFLSESELELKTQNSQSSLKSPSFQYRSTQAASMYWPQLIMMLIPFQLVSSVEKSFLLLVNLE